MLCKFHIIYNKKYGEHELRVRMLWGSCQVAFLNMSALDSFEPDL